MAVPNTNWPEITTTTLFSRSKKAADNVTKNNLLLRTLDKKGNLIPVSGGQAIIQEVEYAENGTYKRYSGYETLNISPSDIYTAAQFPWAQAVVAVTISGLEELQNSGPEQVLPLLMGRIRNAERTFKNNLSSDCYSDGTADGGKQVGGLQLLVAAVNNSGTVGGIDAGVWGFWRNYVGSFASNGLAPSAATIQSMMNLTWINIKRGGDTPDLCIADNTYYLYYLASLQAIQRITSDRSAQAGYQTLKFMDMDVGADGSFQGNTTGNVATGSPLGAGGSWLSGTGAPAGSMYMLNTDYIHFRPHADRNMVPLNGDRFSMNQDAMVRLVGWAGNMTLSNRFMQGLITA